MTSRAGYYDASQVADMERRLADMVRLGTVEQKDYSDPAGPRVRVRSGKVLTGWLPWTVARAGGDRDWSPLDIGEQVIMVAPSGDLAQAVVVGSIHQTAHPAPETGGDIAGRQWSDGARDTYDRASHTRTISVPTGGTIRMVIGGTSLELTDNAAILKATAITLDGDTTVTKSLTVQGATSLQAVESRGHDISSTHRHLNSGGPGTGGVPV